MNDNNMMAKAYPRYALVIFFNWLMYTNMPFLGNLRNYFIYIQLALIIPLLFKRTNIKDIIQRNILLCLFILVVLTSSIVTRSFFYRNLITTLLTIFTVFTFISIDEDNKTEKLFSNIYISMEIIMVISFIGVLLYQFTGLKDSSNHLISYSLGNFIQDGRFFGVLNNCNLLGPLAAISIFLAFFKINDGKNNKLHIAVHVSFMIIDLYLLLGTQNLTALFAFLCGITLILLCYLKKHRKPIFFTVITLGIIAVVVVISNLDLLSDILHRNLTTASSRTIIWNSCFEILKDHPLSGYGKPDNYLAASNIKNLYIHPNGSHNIYIEIATLFGYPALAIYSASIITTLIRMINYYLKGYNIKVKTILVPFLLFVFCLILGLGEAQNLFSASPTMILYITSHIVTNFNLHKLSKEKIH